MVSERSRLTVEPRLLMPATFSSFPSLDLKSEEALCGPPRQKFALRD
jgi:hypothetical protein